MGLARAKQPVAAFQNLPEAAPCMTNFALLDAARIPNLPHLLEAYRLSHQSLFAGRQGRELQDVAPHLVALSGASPQAQDFIWQALDDGHGIFLQSALSAEALRRHLKKFLRARIDRKFVYVKYYLPQNFIYVLDSSRILDGFFDEVAAAMMSDIGFDHGFVLIRAEGTV